MAVRAKKKIPSAAKKPRREVDRRVGETIRLMTIRGNWARKILARQDEKTQEAIREIMVAFERMVDDATYVTVKLKNGDAVKVDVDRKVFEDGWVWAAVRLCMAAYDWDIRVANFKPVRKISTKAGVSNA